MVLLVFSIVFFNVSNRNNQLLFWINIFRERYNMEFLALVGQVGFPIAAAIAAGYFVFLTVKFILQGVNGSVNGLKNIISALDNRVQTMNNDLVKIDALLSYVIGVRPNVDRLAANEGKEDARRD
jgi:hypothetical protein